MTIKVKSEEQIAGIRRSAILAAQALDMIEEHVEAGVTTDYLDNKVHEFIKNNNAEPAPLNYGGFPRSTCISMNEVVCHGIPSEQNVLKDGDILNIDITTILDGYYGDTSRMFTVGQPSDRAMRLVNTTKQCLDVGIEQCYPGNYFGNIGYEISRFAKQHAEPNSGKQIKPGMTFTIEPMINEGKARVKVDKQDQWTARTIDDKLSAQFEHTILVTETGREVLTDIHQAYAIT